MRVLIILLLVAFCLSQPCADNPAYTITNGVLATINDGTTIIPLLLDQSLHANNHRALSLETSLQGGAIRVFFAHEDTPSKRLYWEVQTSSDEEASVRLCIDGTQRSCYSPATVGLVTSSPIFIQVQANRDGSYIRFSITLTNDLPSCQSSEPVVEQEVSAEATPVILQQVLRKSAFPDPGTWTLELEQVEGGPGVQLSNVALYGLTSGQMESWLWDESCLMYQHFASMYTAVSGSDPDTTFRPRVYPNLDASYWGPIETDSTPCLRERETCNSYKISCSVDTGTTYKKEGLPALCLTDVPGDFVFTVQVTDSDSGVWGGPLISGDHTDKDGTHIAALVSSSDVIWRWRVGGLEDQKGTAAGTTAANAPLFVGIQRVGTDAQMRYSVDGDSSFDAWTLLNQIIDLTDPDPTSSVPEEFDLCLTFAGATKDLSAVFDHVVLTILDPNQEVSE